MLTPRSNSDAKRANSPSAPKRAPFGCGLGKLTPSLAARFRDCCRQRCWVRKDDEAAGSLKPLGRDPMRATQIQRWSPKESPAPEAPLRWCCARGAPKRIARGDVRQLKCGSTKIPHVLWRVDVDKTEAVTAAVRLSLGTAPNRHTSAAVKGTRWGVL